MSRIFKASICLTLIICLLIPNLAFAASTSTSTSTAPTVLIQATGIVLQSAVNNVFSLKTEKNDVYSLKGNTAGLESYIGKKVLVQGYFAYDNTLVKLPVAIAKTLYVLKYSPITTPQSTPIPTSTIKPTLTPIPKPTPINIKLTGTVLLSDNKIYKYALATEQNIKYLLAGKTDGLDLYINKKIIVLGYMAPIDSAAIFVVVDYRPIPLPTITPKPTPKPTPTITPRPTQTPAIIWTSGIVSLTEDATYKFALTNQKGIKIMLTGKVDGLEAYLNKRVVIYGYISPIMAITEAKAIINKNILVVIYYQPIPTPTATPKPTPKPTVSPKPTPTTTPTPINIKLAGTVSISDDVTYKYALTTEKNVKYYLTGKVDGLDAYLNKKVVATGYALPVMYVTNCAPIIGLNVFVVVDYQPLPTPSPTTTPIPNTKLTGTVSLTDNSVYKYALTTELNVRYFLTGNVDGLGSYINQKVVVVGYFNQPVTTDLVSDKNVFIVNEYYPLIEKPIPVTILN